MSCSRMRRGLEGSSQLEAPTSDRDRSPVAMDNTLIKMQVSVGYCYA